MRQFACLVLLCVWGGGCRVYHNAWRTLVSEPLEHCDYGDRKEAWHESRELAERAWQERQCMSPGVRFSEDYAEGFIHGYTEYVFAGGRALPPPLPMPPRKYWGQDHATPAGRQAANDWLMGAYDGIGSAEASGYPELMTVPTAAPAVTAHYSGLAIPVHTPAGPAIEVPERIETAPDVPPAPAESEGQTLPEDATEEPPSAGDGTVLKAAGPLSAPSILESAKLGGSEEPGRARVPISPDSVTSAGASVEMQDAIETRRDVLSAAPESEGNILRPEDKTAEQPWADEGTVLESAGPLAASSIAELAKLVDSPTRGRRARVSISRDVAVLKAAGPLAAPSIGELAMLVDFEMRGRRARVSISRDSASIGGAVIEMQHGIQNTPDVPPAPAESEGKTPSDDTTEEPPLADDGTVLENVGPLAAPSIAELAKLLDSILIAGAIEMQDGVENSPDVPPAPAASEGKTLPEDATPEDTSEEPPSADDVTVLKTAGPVAARSIAELAKLVDSRLRDGPPLADVGTLLKTAGPLAAPSIAELAKLVDLYGRGRHPGVPISRDTGNMQTAVQPDNLIEQPLPHVPLVPQAATAEPVVPRLDDVAPSPNVTGSFRLTDQRDE